jgi:hypothetical protein
MTSAWDRRLAARSLAVAGLAALVALLVIATTDDGAPWPRRLSMWAAVAPVLGALGTFAAARLAVARGELTALAALGVDPARAARGAALGGVMAGLVGMGVAASGWADLEALFPRATEAREWSVEGDGVLREATLGIRVEAGGAVTFVGEAAVLRERTGLPEKAEGVTIATLALAAFACPVWVVEGLGGRSPPARGRRSLRRAIVALIAVATLIAAFQVVAAGRASPLWLLASPLLLLADAAAMRYRAGRAA